MTLISGSVIILFLISFPLAHADRFSDWLDAYWAGEITDKEIKKRGQEYQAIQYQKEVLHFDYSKVQNFDKGYVSTNATVHHPAKHIQNDIPIKFKTIHG